MFLMKQIRSGLQQLCTPITSVLTGHCNPGQQLCSPGTGLMSRYCNPGQQLLAAPCIPGQQLCFPVTGPLASAHCIPGHSPVTGLLSAAHRIPGQQILVAPRIPGQQICSPVTGLLAGHCIPGRQGLKNLTTEARQPAARPSGKTMIQSLSARHVVDPQGHPTVDVEVVTDHGLFRSSAPAAEDKDDKVTLDKVNKVIAPELLKKRFRVTRQVDVDEYLMELDAADGNKSGARAVILATSMAVCKAGAAKKGVPLYQHLAHLSGNDDIVLPTPAFDVVAGDKREFLIVPTGAATFAEALEMGAEVYRGLRDAIETNFVSDAEGDERSVVAPDFRDVQDSKEALGLIQDTKEALRLIQDAIHMAGYAGKIEIGMDVTASVLCKEGMYNLDSKNPKIDKSKCLTSDQLVHLYQDLIADFSLCSIKDPFDPHDFPAWTKLTAASTALQIVGGVLTRTSAKLIQRAVDEKACNCVTLRLNEVGSVTEVIRAHLLAKGNGWSTVVCHKCGETEDTFFADLAVGLGTGQIKAGAPCGGDKYDRLLRIEEELGVEARFAGKDFRHPD